MDKSEILKLEAGETLNALVAEHVMGWTRYPEPMHPTDNRTIGGVLYCPPDFPYDCGAANAVPEYSRDIAAAWKIVEKYTLSLVQSDDGWYAISPVDIWHERISCTDKNCIRLIGDDGEIFFPAETPMLAICRAALLAVAKEQER